MSLEGDILNISLLAIGSAVTLANMISYGRHKWENGFDRERICSRVSKYRDLRHLDLEYHDFRGTFSYYVRTMCCYLGEEAAKRF